MKWGGAKPWKANINVRNKMRAQTMLNHLVSDASLVEKQPFAEKNILNNIFL